MQETKPPSFFWWVAGIALLWNLMGLFSFYFHYTATAAVIASWPEAQQRIAEATPRWIFVPFAIATMGGVLGSLGLLLRKRWAEPVLLLSFVAIVVQFSAHYLSTPTWALTGIGGAVLPLCVVAVGYLLVRLAGKARWRGWIR